VSFYWIPGIIYLVLFIFGIINNSRRWRDYSFEWYVYKKVLMKGEHEQEATPSVESHRDDGNGSSWNGTTSV
jgi:hypothetical protein